MEKATKKSSLKPKLQQTTAKVAAILHGKPAKNLHIIAVTGNTGKNIVAGFIHKILLTHKIPSVLITSPANDPITTFTLHKYLAKSLKSGATHVIIEAPAAVIKNYTFHDLPIHTAILTNTAEAETANPTTAIFQNKPQAIILNRDDQNYEHFATLAKDITPITFGRHKDSKIRINRSKLYKKGTEANLSNPTTSFEVATFATGEETVSFMAAAAALALLLEIPEDTITEGIASFEP